MFADRVLSVGQGLYGDSVYGEMRKILRNDHK